MSIRTTVLSGQAMSAINEGAERERRLAKVGGCWTGEGSEVLDVFVTVDTDSESCGPDTDSWDTAKGASRRLFPCVSRVALNGKSLVVQFEGSGSTSGEVSLDVQDRGSQEGVEISLGRAGEAFFGVLVSHESESELSLQSST